MTITTIVKWGVAITSGIATVVLANEVANALTEENVKEFSKQKAIENRSEEHKFIIEEIGRLTEREKNVKENETKELNDILNKYKESVDYDRIMAESKKAYDKEVNDMLERIKYTERAKQISDDQDEMKRAFMVDNHIDAQLETMRRSLRTENNNKRDLELIFDNIGGGDTSYSKGIKNVMEETYKKRKSEIESEIERIEEFRDNGISEIEDTQQEKFDALNKEVDEKKAVIFAKYEAAIKPLKEDFNKAKVSARNSIEARRSETVINDLKHKSELEKELTTFEKNEKKLVKEMINNVDKREVVARALEDNGWTKRAVWSVAMIPPVLFTYGAYKVLKSYCTFMYGVINNMH